MTIQAQNLAQSTADAYSFSRFGLTEWTKAITGLFEMGYDERQVEAIMRSKWTRWAGDESDTPNDPVANDVIAFVKLHVGRNGYSVQELVDETFGE